LVLHVLTVKDGALPRKDLYGKNERPKFGKSVFPYPNENFRSPCQDRMLLDTRDTSCWILTEVELDGSWGEIRMLDASRRKQKQG